MAFGQDPGPGTLSYVTRAVTAGDIFTTTAKFDPKEQQIVKKQVAVVDPVVVFMANGATIVMSMKEAEKRGFLNQPEILNFDSVTDPKTPAGQYKFAMNMLVRQKAFTQLEENVISKCISRHGHPLPNGCTYARTSIYFDDEASIKEAV